MRTLEATVLTTLHGDLFRDDLVVVGAVKLVVRITHRYGS